LVGFVGFISVGFIIIAFLVPFYCKRNKEHKNISSIEINPTNPTNPTKGNIAPVPSRRMICVLFSFPNLLFGAPFPDRWFRGVPNFKKLI
jgi:hypothetical protein